MTYVSKTANLNVKRLQFLEGELSGQPSASGYFTFNSLILDNFDSGTAPTFGSATLSLSPGRYIVRAFLSTTRTINSQNYRFVWESNGSDVGKQGHTGEYSNIRSDCAEAVIEDLNSNISLKLKATHIQTSAPTLATDSRIYIWRVDAT